MKKNVYPELGRLECCKLLKTEGLKQVVKNYGFDGLIVGVRRDEEGSRSKERIFSERNPEDSWDYTNQPSEFWNQFKTDFPKGNHIRVHPILSWTELDIWQYIRRENIPIIDLYFAKDGKSTIIGRLLYDTKSLPQGVVDKVQQIADETGKNFEFAYLLDAFVEERQQGITIDTTQLKFSTTARDYLIIDAPGHKEFLKNMISGAANANAAFPVIDAQAGVREQSRRHAYLLRAEIFGSFKRNKKFSYVNKSCSRKNYSYKQNDRR